MPAHDPADRPVREVKGPVLRDGIPMKRRDRKSQMAVTITELLIQSNVISESLWKTTACRAEAFPLAKE